MDFLTFLLFDKHDRRTVDLKNLFEAESASQLVYAYIAQP